MKKRQIDLIIYKSLNILQGLVLKAYGKLFIFSKKFVPVRNISIYVAVLLDLN